MSNSIAPGSSADVNVKVTALTTNPNVPVTYKTIILKKNLVNGVNTLTQEMISATNTKYVVKYDYVLGDDIAVPAGCILEFDGGSVSASGSNDTITGNNTGVKAGLVKIFNTDIVLAGTWKLIDVYPEWFGAKGDYDPVLDTGTDDSTAINKSIQFAILCNIRKIKFGLRRYFVSNTIIVNSPDFVIEGSYSPIHEAEVKSSVYLNGITFPAIYSNVSTVLELTGTHCSGTQFKNIAFVNNYRANTNYTSKCIVIKTTDYSSTMRFDTCYFSGYDKCIYFDSVCSWYTLAFLTITNCAAIKNNIILESADDNWSTNHTYRKLIDGVIIQNNRLHGNGALCKISTGWSSAIIDCNNYESFDTNNIDGSESSYEYGIDINATRNTSVQITNNYCENLDKKLIYVNAGWGISSIKFEDNEVTPDGSALPVTIDLEGSIYVKNIERRRGNEEITITNPSVGIFNKESVIFNIQDDYAFATDYNNIVGQNSILVYNGGSITGPLNLNGCYVYPDYSVFKDKGANFRNFAIGQLYMQNGKPTWWDGTQWVDATGAPV